jgi:hypothetical protein
MAKERETIGTDGRPLPILPPERDPRVWARLVRIMFYLPGFMGLLLIKSGEPTGFGITIELLMLSSAAAIVGGVFVGAGSSGAGADTSSKVGVWSGSLVLELLAVVPFLAAIPVLFHELANSNLLHNKAAGAIDVTLGPSELLPMVAILPFMLYQLAGFGTLHFILVKWVNWVVNIGILCLIVAAYFANRQEDFVLERRFGSGMVIAMAVIAIYGVLRLKQMQADYDARCPVKEKKKDKDKE